MSKIVWVKVKDFSRFRGHRRGEMLDLFVAKTGSKSHGIHGIIEDVRQSNGKSTVTISYNPDRVRFIGRGEIVLGAHHLENDNG